MCLPPFSALRPPTSYQTLYFVHLILALCHASHTLTPQHCVLVRRGVQSTQPAGPCRNCRERGQGARTVQPLEGTFMLVSLCVCESVRVSVRVCVHPLVILSTNHVAPGMSQCQESSVCTHTHTRMCSPLLSSAEGHSTVWTSSFQGRRLNIET